MLVYSIFLNKVDLYWNAIRNSFTIFECDGTVDKNKAIDNRHRIRSHLTVEKLKL